MNYQPHKTLKLLPALAALLFLLTAAGCGVLGDGINKARAIQLSEPDELCTGAFYKTATPEKVKQAVGGRSLARLSCSGKRYDKAEPMGMFSDVQKAMNVFLPASSVKTWTAYPLELALQYSPHSEVIPILLEAGAKVRPYNVPRYAKGKNARPETVKLLLDYGDREIQLEALEFFTKRNEREYVLHCLAWTGAPRPDPAGPVPGRRPAPGKERNFTPPC